MVVNGQLRRHALMDSCVLTVLTSRMFPGCVLGTPVCRYMFNVGEWSKRLHGSAACNTRHHKKTELRLTTQLRWLLHSSCRVCTHDPLAHDAASPLEL